jgi:pimeloyl-ACP methyl ester carboxylesterase
MIKTQASPLRIHFHVEGHGPDVILLHGWSSSRRMWHYLTPALARTYRCWSVDLPGFGDSDKPDDAWYSIPNFTASVRRFMEGMGLRRAHIVGHSMGGMIALDFAATHPEHVERLAVINPVVTGRAYLRAFANLQPRAHLVNRTHELTRRVVHPVARHPLSTSLNRGVRDISRRAHDFTRATPASLLGSGRAIVNYDVRAKLSQIAATTLVVLGTWDTQIPNSEGHLVAVEVPRARLVVYSAGHAITDDRPGEMAPLIRNFLA